MMELRREPVDRGSGRVEGVDIQHIRSEGDLKERGSLRSCRGSP